MLYIPEIGRNLRRILCCYFTKKNKHGTTSAKYLYFLGTDCARKKFYFIAASQTFAECLMISISLVYNAILCCYFSNKKQIGMNKGDWLYEISAWFIILFGTYLRKQWYHKSAFNLFVMSLQKSLNTLQRCINLFFFCVYFSTRTN